MKKLTELDKKDIELAHLNLDLENVDFSKLRDPFAGYYSSEHYMEILRAIREPKNFYFTLKYILNLDVPPIHLVCLEELWNHAFPMMLAARGFGKTFLLAEYCLLRLLITQGCRIIITSASFRQAQFVMDYMETILGNAPIYKDITGTTGVKKKTDNYYLRVGDSLCRAIPLGDGCCNANTMLTVDKGIISIGKLFGYCAADGQIKSIPHKVWGNGNFNNSDQQLYNGYKETKKIKTKRGYSFEATNNHKIKILRSGEIIWARMDELLIDDYILVDRSIRWHEGNFNCTEDEAYTLGALIGDGSWVNQYYIRFATNDTEILEYINNAFEKPLCQVDKHHYQVNSKSIRQKWLDKWGLCSCYTIDKSLPNNILSAPKNIMTKCLQGLFDTDGGIQVNQDSRGGTSISVSFWNTSERLVDEIRYILLHYGIISSKYNRQRNNLNWNKEYSLVITGKNVKIFAEQIGFRLKRKQALLSSGLVSKARNFSTDDNIPGILDKMIEIANLYQKNTIGSKLMTTSKLKSFKQANLRLVGLFIERYKDCDKEFITKLKVLANENIYYDQIKFIENSSCETYDIHIPELHEYCAGGFYSHNSKIRGYRATQVICEEFSSIPPQVFEEVISGFAASASSPIENMRRVAQIEKLKQKGLWNDAVAEQMGEAYKPNQVIISGTASWSFNHFAKYWKEYSGIIKSKGNAEKLHEVMGDRWSKDLDWKDYTIIRIPLEIIPKGMMDDKNIARAKAGSTVGISDNEYNCIFSKDSSGFFPRKLIESCVCKQPILIGNDKVQFSARLYGDTARKYVISVDPASESDNFAIVVLEINDNHIRIVYCWTTSRRKAFKRFTDKETNENSFYTYAARKIRSLLNLFPCEVISLDSGGGGIEVMSALHDLRRLEQGELPIWPIRQDNVLFWPGSKQWGYDDEAGQHIIEMVSMSKTDYVVEANHSLKRSLENKTLLFPYADAITLISADIDDELADRDYDTLDDVVMELEQLKEELATIMHTTTLTGRDQWITPEIILPGNKKGRMRKDRYSACALGHFAAIRLMKLTTIHHQQRPAGGFITDFRDKSPNGVMYSGPSWYTDAANKSCLGIAATPSDRPKNPFKRY